MFERGAHGAAAAIGEDEGDAAEGVYQYVKLNMAYEVPVTILDGLGQEQVQEVTVDVLKNRFFMLGLQTGMAMQMLVIAMLMMMLFYGHATMASSAILEFSGEYYPLYRALFLVCLFGALHGICLFIWKRSGINYRTMLSVPHAHNYHSVIRASFTIMTVAFCSFVLYALTITVDFTPNRHVWPALAISLSLLYLIAPWDWMAIWADRVQRYNLVCAIGKVLITPAYPTTFGLNFIADIVTSMPKVFVDILFTTCIYATGEVFFAESSLRLGTASLTCSDQNFHFYVGRILLSVFPFWIRLLQCIRLLVDSREVKHLANAFKYLSSMTLVFLGIVAQNSAAWLAFAVITTVYTFIWDVIMDWGHGTAALRSYYPAWCYYAAIPINALGRIGLVILISPNLDIQHQHIVLLLGMLEMLRRAQWALFRLEWEQIYRNNKPNREMKRRASALSQELLNDLSRRMLPYFRPEDKSTDEENVIQGALSAQRELL
ncbi:hypothetical protein AB1Y20_005754 [Prymnesium parvum]|uniref:EXS domain-containing protein n=1 Tax=Prymnesium parvum TaxID=97485 RepID=A0AB34J2R4_PRYPA